MAGYLEVRKLEAPVLSPTGKAGDFDAEQVDCPKLLRSVEFEEKGAGSPPLLRHDGDYVMAYAGWDGQANRLGLARSRNLKTWTRQGLALDLGGEKDFDSGSVSAPFPFAWKGRFYLLYCGFPKQGYEAGPGCLGLAVSDDLKSWTKLGEILKPEAAWEAGGLFQPYLLRYQDTFYLFYNARAAEPPHREQTGLATSKDLKTWTKHPGNPLLTVGPEGAWDSLFASDPWVERIGGLWHLFYYGFDGRHAQEGVATSPDLLHWTKSAANPILRVGPEGSLDAVHAHKPCVVFHEGRWYHYYCAVGARGRVIALAVSPS